MRRARALRLLVVAVAVAGAGSGAALPRVARADVPTGCRPRPTAAAHAVTALAADRLRLAPGTTRGARSGEYVVRDGRVLVQAGAGEEGWLYTAAEWKLRESQLAEDLAFRGVARGEPFHLLRGLIDDGDGFIPRVPSLLGALHARLASDRIDDSLEEAAITQLAARWRESGCRPDPAVFRQLTAAVGDLFLRKARGTGARWSTRERDGVVEPIVAYTVAGEKRVVAPWDWASRLLARDERLDSLLSSALAPPTAVSAAHAATEAPSTTADGAHAAP